MATFDTWESYFYPAPDHGTLRNLLDERDPGVLASKEYSRTADRQREIFNGEVKIERTYDAAHVRSMTGGSALIIGRFC